MNSFNTTNCIDCGKQHGPSSRERCMDCRVLHIKAKQKAYRKPLNPPNKRPNAIYKRYKTSAIKRKLSFEITKEEFLKYWKKPCYYCNSDIPTVGLDRLNNEVGYTKSNIVPCCTTCNLMKRHHEPQFFIEHCRKIVENNNGVLLL